MKSTTLPFAALCCLLLCVGACHKAERKTSSCSPVICGYGSTGDLPFGDTAPMPMGIINPATASLSAFGSFYNYPATNFGAFDRGADNYYTFNMRNPDTILYKVTTAGSITGLTHTGVASPGIFFKGSLAFNNVAHKLYQQRVADICEVLVAGTTWSYGTAIATVHGYPRELTVDENTGDMYMITSDLADTSHRYLEHCHAGSMSVIAAYSGYYNDIMGLRYNSNNNMLYAIYRDTAAPFKMMRIDPGTGSMTPLASLPDFNYEFYSAVLDPCNDHYLISTLYGGAPTFVPHLLQYDLSGALLHDDVTTKLFMAMDVKY